MLKHLLFDTAVLFIILTVALRNDVPKWPKLAATCAVVAVGKAVLYVLFGLLAIVPFLILLGLFLRLAYPITNRTTVYILGTFMAVVIAFSALVELTTGALRLFFE